MTTTASRTAPGTTPSFEHGLEQTVLPGRGLILVAPTRRDDFQNRLADATGDVAEIFQVNARWRADAFEHLPAVEDQQALRAWFIGSGRTFDIAGDAALATPQLDLSSIPPPLGPALHSLSQHGAEAGLLFAADVCVVTRHWAYLLPAGADRLVRMRRTGLDRFTALRRCVSPDMRAAFESAEVLLAVVVAPQRLQVTHGPRGYRNSLLETGMLLGQIGQLTSRHGLGPSIAVDFIDTAVDHCLDQDGVERFVIALVAVSANSFDEGTELR